MVVVSLFWLFENVWRGSVYFVVDIVVVVVVVVFLVLFVLGEREVEVKTRSVENCKVHKHVLSLVFQSRVFKFPPSRLFLHGF